MRFKVRLNRKETELEVVQQGDRLIVSYGKQTFDARLIYTDGAHFVLEVEEEGPDGFICRKRIRAAGYQDGDQRQLWANGRMINYQRLREGSPDQLAAEPASLSASIPAVVSELLVQVGDRVETGDKLILLESMKMILPVQAPFEGIVSAINCSVGEAVQPGIQLIEIEQ
jgi:acetyl-CoA carboxylase biotin carboxyl carrier protein